MPDIAATFDKAFRAAIAKAFGPGFEDVDPVVKASANPEFGDYQANAAMALGKRVGKNPREVAQAIAAAVDLSGIAEDAPTVAGPGFINVRLSRRYVECLVADMAMDERLGVERRDSPDKVIIDYSSPNVAKEMHIGHLRSTIIGDAIARVLSFLGHEVVRQNHLGDWGTQFGMIIERMIELGWTVASGVVSAPGGKAAAIADLNELYRDAKARFDGDESFAERARKRVVALQSGDEDTIAMWKALIEESKRHFEATYARLGVLLDEGDYCGESFYNPMLQGVAEELRAAGVAKDSDGALCVFPAGFKGPEGEPIPLIIRKSDGGFGYDATDMAAIRHRVSALGGTRLAYLTDLRQKQHFSMIFAAARDSGWLPEGVRAEHVWFGAMLGEDGKPFKTRSGEVVRLEDVIDEGEARARALVDAKNPELDPEERARIARAVGIGAIKYADLSNDRIKDYVFSWDRMLAFDGNTAPYLQNAYVRIMGIFRKAGADARSYAKASIADPKERALAMRLLQFGPALAAVERDLAPHKLCTYLYDLASDYHSFYEHCQVLGAEGEVRDSRLALSALAARTLAKGLGLLGIDVVERM
jgi:arginyl-tRNA synthetase